MNKKKSILIVSTEFPPAPGGIGSHAFALANELKILGWEVTVATEQNYATDEEIIAFNNSQNFQIVRLNPTPSAFSLLKKVFFLFKLILKNRPKYICGTGKHGAWFGYLISKICFKKSILIGHGTEFTVTMSERSKKINKFVYSNASILVSVSNYTLKTIEKVGIKNKNAHVIHNGANPLDFFKLKNEEVDKIRVINNLMDKNVILTIGNVTPRKGQEWIIRALPQILEEFPNTHYYCIGLPSIKSQLENLATDLNISSNVHFLGRLSTSEINKWTNAADIFAMTSVHNEGDFEGFGISVIEAALCGKTAIVTNESGVYESIIDNYTGFGVPERNPPAIAEKICLLLRDKDLKIKMETAALERAHRDFTWPKVVLKYQKLLLGELEERFNK